MAFMAPLAIAGLAMSAAGAAANYATERARQNEMEKIRNRTQAQVAANQKQATDVWQRALTDTSPEAQTKLREEKTAQLGTAMENVAGGTTEPSIVKTTDQSPKIVASETAKQLGTALDEAKAQMASQAALGGWSATPDMIAHDLGRSGEKIGTLANFTGGDVNAMNMDLSNAASAQPALPLGDILEGAGGAAMGASGGGGALGSALGGAGSWFTTPVGQAARLKTGNIQAGDLSQLF